nr:SDR family oxidoreductase [Kofleriaceae bacterium]
MPTQRDNPSTVAIADEPPALRDPAAVVADVTAILPLLEYLAADLRRLADLDEPLRIKLATLAGALSRPDRYTRRALGKELSRQRTRKLRDDDRAVLDQTGIRALRKEPVFRTPLPMPGLALEAAVRDGADQESEAEDAWAAAEAERPLDGETARRRVHAGRICYVCKTEFFELHEFYDQMCRPCAEFNWHKRTLTADLRGRIVLVTGARVKIGYQAAIKLLRAGAEVVVVTRFPVDAAQRYGREHDASDWQHRLHVYGADLRHTPSVEALCQHLLATLPRLDGIINNACQTVRRPSGFYDHLLATEMQAMAALQGIERNFVARHAAFMNRAAPQLSSSAAPLTVTTPGPNDRGQHNIWQSAVLSQVPLLAEDLQRGGHLFPAGRLDADLQQVDLRGFNSWRMTLTDVPTAELLEVHLVNAVAPFVINARLKPLMARVATRDTHIVNVSAMEGQFYRRWKTDKHPHTNMAKAALNMMTRTSAADYRRDGIHMNSVDTGWVTDEDPVELAARKTIEERFHPPLDIIDGAARIVDPIIHG